ncbi:hypothetical protein LTR84_001621 [Exophiala bonariae]|uniref:Uncharacterized protein n=1 Tax=Exophiala bonariae TaxID=1690606 RepID=A0AAV9NDC0_9EURO|nr:hypothetical protein LTR84_001621 [Exophiala bonariae]
MPKLYYFRAPNFDISPDSATAPRLGSIFSSLKRLTRPLNQDEYVTIPTHLRNNSTKSDFKDTSSKNIDVGGGVYADIASGVGSAEAIYGFAQDRKHTYACEVLETEEFDPTAEFVQECVFSSKSVQDFIAESFVGNKSVYMITGLKIATGLRMADATSTTQGPSLKVGVSALPFGVPAEAGPKADLKVGTGRDVQFGGSSKIVFAYRAIKVKSRRDGKVSYKDLSGGEYAIGKDEGEYGDEGWDLEVLDEEDVGRMFPGSEKMDVAYEESTG